MGRYDPDRVDAYESWLQEQDDLGRDQHDRETGKNPQPPRPTRRNP